MPQEAGVERWEGESTSSISTMELGSQQGSLPSVGASHRQLSNDSHDEDLVPPHREARDSQEEHVRPPPTQDALMDRQGARALRLGRFRGGLRVEPSPRLMQPPGTDLEMLGSSRPALSGADAEAGTAGATETPVTAVRPLLGIAPGGLELRPEDVSPPVFARISDQPDARTGSGPSSPH